MEQLGNATGKSDDGDDARLWSRESKVAVGLNLRRRIDDPLTIRTEKPDAVFFGRCEAFIFEGLPRRAGLGKTTTVENGKFNVLLSTFRDYLRN